MVKIKLKTKSSVKKRFKITAKGKVNSTQAKKRHGMSKRSKRSLRTQRGTDILKGANAKLIKSYMPYNRKII